MRECGTPRVPSFSALRKRQAELTETLGIHTTHHTSALGNEFYANGPADLFKLDWANPLVRPHIQPFVEIADSLSEFFQGKQLQCEDLDRLQLMWYDEERAPDRHFFIKEVARLDDGHLVIPLMWVCVKQEDGQQVHYEGIGLSFADDREYLVYRLKLTSNTGNLTDEYPEWLYTMPHPARKIANGRPMYTLSSTDWSDDVSGNRTKQYNPHTNVYLASLSLPHKKLQQEYFVRFCSTSPHASALEQMEAVEKDVGADCWHEAYDCLHHREILFRIISRLKPADNPQQSELCSHIGLKGNFFCRRCRVGGTRKDVESNDGYHALFTSGKPRTVGETIDAITAQIHAACTGVEKAVEALQTETGVKDKIAQHWITQLISRSRILQKERIHDLATRDQRLNSKNLTGNNRQQVKNEIIMDIQEELLAWLYQQPAHSYQNLSQDSPLRNQLRAGDHYNVLLKIDGINVHRDTPVEILHTVLLGTDKYAWLRTHFNWTKEQESLFAQRLHATSVDGLSLNPIRGKYLMQYKNALVGKHFKALQQISVFHIHGLLEDRLLLDLWKATGELGALLWYHEINDVEQYLSDLEVLLANVLDVWAVIDPERIIQKPKLHILPHILDDIRNFGPAIIYSTEIFECWNAIFRMCSVLSNHHAPSHDIAEALANLERFKHQVSGGWWRDKAGQYTRCGEKVRNYLRTEPELQRRLGWVERPPSVAGTIKLLSRRRRISGSYLELLHSVGSLPAPLSEPVPSPPQWSVGKYVVAQSGDLCREGSWVFFRKSGSSESLATETEVSSEQMMDATHQATIVVSQFDVLDVRDTRLGMPVLVPLHSMSEDASQMQADSTNVSPKDIMFIFNAQHDCRFAGCNADGVQYIREERRETARTEPVIVHRLGRNDRYFINMHAIHNAALLRRTLPRDLYKPAPYFPNREEKHHEIAAKLQITGPAKRAAAAAKAAETRKRNKENQAQK
ncbi:hypothetical protein BXZ70DRAFT_884608 [Cristinia sonorae]|uniref:Uncharacterized protein n=1 Tax=Cristinia sonorae TaxID=1940300 RepID=A0A8K0UXW2_9AGAR|nr:hypothetical protein BXZ70DRAFT_884608 [Cristinia sonorae]